MLTGCASPLVSGIVIEMQREHPKVVALSVGEGSVLLAESKRVNGSSVRPEDVADLFPPGASVLYEGVPVHRPDLLERLHNPSKLALVEGEEIVQEDGVVEVEGDLSGHAVSCWLESFPS